MNSLVYITISYVQRCTDNYLKYLWRRCSTILNEIFSFEVCILQVSSQRVSVSVNNTLFDELIESFQYVRNGNVHKTNATWKSAKMNKILWKLNHRDDLIKIYVKLISIWTKSPVIKLIKCGSFFLVPVVIYRNVFKRG